VFGFRSISDVVFQGISVFFDIHSVVFLDSLKCVFWSHSDPKKHAEMLLEVLSDHVFQ
jgi:hypothetical protein